jgi:hypothetical protein
VKIFRKIFSIYLISISDRSYIPGKGTDFTLGLLVKNLLCGPHSLLWIELALSARVKPPECEAAIHHERSCTFMAWYIIKGRENVFCLYLN